MEVCFEVYAKFRASNRPEGFNPALLHCTDTLLLKTQLCDPVNRNP